MKLKSTQARQNRNMQENMNIYAEYSMNIHKQIRVFMRKVSFINKILCYIKMIILLKLMQIEQKSRLISEKWIKIH